jgi:hypothetical protein
MTNIEEKETPANSGTGWVLWAWLALLIGFAIFAVIRFLRG